MKCFYHFKDKSRSRSRAQKSAPILQNQSKSDISEAERVTKSSSTSLVRTIPEISQQKPQNLRVFTFSELRKATNDFNRLLKIGEGGFGCVYKGTIKPVEGNGDPLVVAIKKLNKDGCQVYSNVGLCMIVEFVCEMLQFCIMILLVDYRLYMRVG